MQMIAKQNGPAANLVGNTTSAQIFPLLVNGLASATLACLIPVPGSFRLEQRQFIVRASGFVTGGTTTNVTTTLYAGTSLTPGSNTVLQASTARAVNSTSAPWRIEAKLIFDSVSGKLHGTVEHEINNLFDAPAALTNVVTALVGSAEPVFNLCVGITFSASNANNLAGLGNGAAAGASPLPQGGDSVVFYLEA